MKKNVISTFTLCCLLVLLSISNVFAVSEPHFQGKPEFITFPAANMPTIGQLTTIMNGYGLQSPEGLKLLNAEPDGLGMIHYRYQEINNGSPVNGTMWIVHTRNGNIESMNGVLYATLPTGNTISINNASGYQAALKYLPSPSYYTTSTTGSLYWALPNGNTSAQSFRLCYRYDIYAKQPLSRKYIFVDATTGSVVADEDRINEVDVPCTAITAYSGTQPIVADSYNGSYRLREAGRGGGIETYNLATGTDYGSAVDFTNATKTWNDVDAAMDQYATDAHWGAEMTYDFYKNTFNRNSLDNAGLKLLSYVHFSQSYLNAFWDGQEMTYGDGCCGYTPLTALDICGHEMSHGVTQFTAGLIYQNESGALNEGFSDCMGTAIEFYGKPATANWTIGEDIGAAFRNMADPKQFQQPDTYNGQYWYTGGSDNGGVHTNSGVLNYWFYLVSMGGSGTNDDGNSYTVTGITLAKAQAILYLAQTSYMFPSAQYSDAAALTVKAATQIYGACSPEVITVTNAWYAVGISSASPISSVSITANPTGEICPGTSVVFTAAPLNGGTAPTYQWKVNGSNVGTGSTSFTSTTLNQNDVVTCIMTPNATCLSGKAVTSNSITMTIGAVAAAVNVTANPSGIICSGSPTIFTANPVNGGASPSYIWKVNGSTEGTNSSTFTTSSLNDNDMVECIMTSGISCATNNPATSTPIVVTVVTCTGLNVSFKSEDTVQVNQGLNLTNTSVGYSDFMWNFCTSVPEDSPTFTNLGSLNGELDAVDYTTLREENGQFYSFTGRAEDGELAGAVYGNSFNNTPTASTWYNGVAQMFGLQSELDTATGKETFMSVGVGYLYRVWDGSSLASPFGYCCVQRIPYTNTGITWNASDLQIVKFKGALYGFVVDYDDTSGFFVTLNFGNSLYNTPIANKYRYKSYITTPSSLCVRYNEQTNHFILFICSQNPQQLARFDLGSSPGGIPIFMDASNPFPHANGLRDVAIIQECGSTYGLVVFNGDTAKVVKFHFAGDNISGAYTNSYTLPLSLGAGMKNPYSFSEFYNADTTSAERVMFITDNSAQLIRMNFNRCTNSIAPTTHAANPAPVIFPAPGTYTVSLTGGIGTAYEETFCKTIVVKPCFSLTYAKVSIVANPGNTFCPGTSVTFTASPVNGGTAPVYQWLLNGGNVGTNSPTYTTTTLATGDKVWCRMTSNAQCITGSPCLSDTISITLLPTHPAAVSITANPANNVCSGKPAVFTASSSNQGTLSYQWKVNSGDVGSNSTTYSNSSLNNHDAIYCTMSSNSLCVTGNPATSNKIVMTVIPTVTAGVSITETPGDTICAGTSVKFTANPVNGGTPVYQWKLNGANVGSNSATYTNTSLANANTISCVMTSNATCVVGSPATSNTVTMTVYPNVIGSVSIAASPSNSVCAGSAIKFTATPVSGATPAYQWKLNSADVGSNTSTYNSNALTNGDTVSCTVSLTGHCITNSPASSNKIVVTVNPYAVAGNVSAVPDSVCPGSTSMLKLRGYTGSPIQWQYAVTPPSFNKIGGATDTVYTAGITSTTYYRAIVGAGKCPDTTAQVKVVALSQPFADFTSRANGKQVNFTVTSATSDVTNYHWSFGDDSTSAQTNPVHTYLTRDTFTVCLMVNNKYDCPDTTCNKIDLRATGVNAVTAGTDFHVYPSPFSDKLFITFSNNANAIESLELFDVLGRRVTGINVNAAQSKTVQIDVPHIAAGMYYLFVKTEDRSWAVPVVRQ